VPAAAMELLDGVADVFVESNVPELWQQGR
jgi:hypothetical protein